MEKKFKGIKKLLAYVAAVALPVFSVVIGGGKDVYAADTGYTAPNGVTYTWNGSNTLTITGSGTTDDSWKSCSEFNGLNVQSNLTNVVFNSKTITGIGADSFSDCTGLATIKWTKHGITSIGDRAFKGGKFAATITVPATVTQIGNEAYRSDGNTTVTTLNIENNSSDIKIGSNAFSGLTKLTKVTVGASGSQKAMIADDAFNGTALTTVTINTADITETKAFQGNTTLKTITFPQITGEIPAEICKNCTGLTTVSSLGKSTLIGRSAFEGCTALTTVGGTSGQIKIGSKSDATSIGENAFKDCTSITKVSSLFSDTIGDGAFQGCTGLKTVSSDLTRVNYIGKNAFQGCSSLTQVGSQSGAMTFPANVQLIDEYAFSGCSNPAITKVQFYSEPVVKAHAFAACPNIQTVTIYPNTDANGNVDEALRSAYQGSNFEPDAFDNNDLVPAANTKDVKIIGVDPFTDGYGATALCPNPDAVVTFSNGGFATSESFSSYSTVGGSSGTTNIQQHFIDPGTLKDGRYLQTATRRDDTYVDIEGGAICNGELCDVRIYVWGTQAKKWNEGSVVVENGEYKFKADANGGSGQSLVFGVTPDGEIAFFHSAHSGHTAQEAHAEVHIYKANTLKSNHDKSLDELKDNELDYKGLIKASGNRIEKWNVITGIQNGQTQYTSKVHRDYIAIKESQVQNVFLSPSTYYAYSARKGFEDCVVLETHSKEGTTDDQNSVWLEVNGSKNDPIVINTELTCSSIVISYAMDKHVVIKNPAYVTTWGDEGISKTTQTCDGECDDKSSDDAGQNYVEHTIAEDKDTETITINATVKDGYEFVRWDKYDAYDGTLTQESYKTTQSFTVTVKEKDKYFFKAITKKKPVPQYITTWGDDGVSKTTQSNDPSPVSNNSEHKVSHTAGESVTVTATVKSGYSFVRWDAYDKAESAGGKVITSSYKTTASFNVTAPEGQDLYFKAVTEKLYKATCIDVAEKVGGTELGRPTNPANPKTGLSNGTKVSGSEWGTDSPYANYAYDSCTEATINNGDVIVYRIFKLNQINLTTWGDAGISTTTQNSVESADNAEFKKAYNVGTQVTVSAKTAANHKFIRWDKYDAYNGKLLGTASTSNTYKFTLNENTYLKAVTEEVLYKADCYSRIKGTATNIAGPATKTGLANGTKVEGNNTGYFGDIPAVITYQGKDYVYTNEYTTETINGADVTVYRYYTEVLYNAVCIDVIGDINGTELGRPAPNPKTGLSNGTKVSGSDWGTDSPYPFFDYKTCTTETINKGDVTVYRIFEPQKSIIYDVEQGKAGDGISLTAKTGEKTYNVLSLQGGDGAAAWAAQHADDCPFVPLSADNKTKLAATLNVNTGAGTTSILGKTVNASGQIPNVIKDADGKTVVKFIKELDETPDFAGTADVKWEVVPALRIDYNDGTAPDPANDILFTDDEMQWGTTVSRQYGTNKKFIGFNTKWNGKGRNLGEYPEFNASSVRQIMEEQGTNIATIYAIYEKVTVLQPNY